MTKTAPPGHILHKLSFVGILLCLLVGCHDSPKDCSGAPGIAYYVVQDSHTCQAGICDITLEGEGCDDTELHASACDSEEKSTAIGAHLGQAPVDGGSPGASTCSLRVVTATFSHEATCTATIRMLDGRVLTFGIHAYDSGYCGIEAAGDEGRIVYMPH